MKTLYVIWMGVLFLLICAVATVRAGIASGGSVSPEDLSSGIVAGDLIIGQTEYGYVTLSGGSEPSALWVANGGSMGFDSKLTVSGGGLFSINNQSGQNGFNVYKGDIWVVSYGYISNRVSMTLGDVNAGQYSTVYVSTNGILKQPDCTFSCGQILIDHAGRLDSRISGLHTNSPGASTNEVTVRHEGSIITGPIDLSGGMLTIESGGYVEQGGTLESYMDEYVTYAVVDGVGSIWGNSSNASHYIKQGATVMVRDGGAVTSTYVVVGQTLVGSDVLTNVAHVTLRDNGTRMHVVDNGNGELHIGDAAQCVFDVENGAVLQVDKLTTAKHSSQLRVSGDNTFFTNAGGVTVEAATMLIESNAAAQAGSVMLRAGGNLYVNGTNTELTASISAYDGNVFMSNGLMQSTWINLGSTSQSIMNMQGGRVECAGLMRAGYSDIGQLSLSDAAWFSCPENYIGASGNDAWGTVSVSGNGTVFDAAGGSLEIGPGRGGSFGVYGGGIATVQTVRVALESNVTGYVQVHDAGSSLVCDQFVLGSNGLATLDIQNAGSVTAACPLFACGSGWTTVKVSGVQASFATTNTLGFGSEFGRVCAWITNGACLSCGDAMIAGGTDAVGRVTLKGLGSRFLINGDLDLAGGECVIETGGAIQVEGVNVYNEYSTGVSGSFRMNGGWAFLTDDLGVQGNVRLEGGAKLSCSNSFAFFAGDQAAMSVAGSGTVWSNSGDVQLSSIGSDYGPVAVQTGAVLYATSLEVGAFSAGDFDICGSGAKVMVGTCAVGFDTEGGEAGFTNRLRMKEGELDAGSVGIFSSGELAGDGTVRGAVTNDGRVAPGTGGSAGTLNCSDGYEQTTNGTLAVDLFGSPALSSFDVLQSSGDVSLTGTLQVTVHGWTPVGTNDFQIISTKGTVGGAFTDIQVTGCESDRVTYIGDGTLRVVGDELPPSGWLRFYGTNEALLSSDADPSLEDGTDFGTCTKGVTVSNVFSVMNASNSPLTIASWTEYDPDSVFEVVSAPDEVNYLTQSNVVITFKPVVGGVFTAVVEITSSSSDSPFLLNLQGSAKNNQVINFQNPGAQMTTNSLMLDAVAQSGLPISYSVSSPGLLNGSNLTFEGSGSVTVTASQVGNTLWNPAADVTHVLDVSKSPQQPLVFAPATSMAYGTTNLLTLGGGSGTGLVVFSASGPGVIDGNNLIITNSSGTVLLTATRKTDSMYLASVTNATVDVEKATQSVALTPAQIYVGTTGTLVAVASSGLPVQFEVLTTNLAELVSSNQLYCVQTGRVDLVLSASGNTYYYALNSTNSIQVIPEDVLIEFERQGDAMIISWDSETGCVYSIQYAVELSGEWYGLEGHTNLPGTGGQMTYSNNLEEITTNSFYRLQADE